VDAILSGNNSGTLTVREGTQQVEDPNAKTEKRRIPDNFKAVVDPKNAN